MLYSAKGRESSRNRAAAGTPKVATLPNGTAHRELMFLVPSVIHKNAIITTQLSLQRCRTTIETLGRCSCGTLRHLTRHKISDRDRERAWPQAGRTNYAKFTGRSGARCAASPG